MHFAIFHCHNSSCGHRVWVPSDKLGLRGRCPECGEFMNIPEEVPAEQFFEGPDIMHDFEEPEAALATLQLQSLRRRF